MFIQTLNDIDTLPLPNSTFYSCVCVCMHLCKFNVALKLMQLIQRSQLSISLKEEPTYMYLQALLIGQCFT